MKKLGFFNKLTSFNSQEANNGCEIERIKQEEAADSPIFLINQERVLIFGCLVFLEKIKALKLGGIYNFGL